jgi:hypothetical protein
MSPHKCTRCNQDHEDGAHNNFGGLCDQCFKIGHRINPLMVQLIDQLEGMNPQYHKEFGQIKDLFKREDKIGFSDDGDQEIVRILATLKKKVAPPSRAVIVELLKMQQEKAEYNFV